MTGTSESGPDFDGRGKCRAAILAGGSSVRMGLDKAALRFDVGGRDVADRGQRGSHGETLLERTVRIASLATGGRSALVVGRERPESWTVSGTEFVLDDMPGHGPIGGLRCALRQCAAGSSRTDPPSILALACDMPLVTDVAIRWLVDTWADVSLKSCEAGTNGLAVRGRNGRLEPLFSVYCATCLPEIDVRIAFGRRSLTRWIEESGRFVIRNAPDEVVAALVNVNTPDEWRALGATASGRTLPARECQDTVTT